MALLQSAASSGAVLDWHYCSSCCGLCFRMGAKAKVKEDPAQLRMLVILYDAVYHSSIIHSVCSCAVYAGASLSAATAARAATTVSCHCCATAATCEGTVAYVYCHLSLSLFD
jgi:hypothetical protein